MRIYFCGSHATGKSTLVRYTSEKYNLPTIHETARMILSEQELQIDSLRSNLEAADSYQKSIFFRQISEEKKYNSYVSDRCLIDILSYSAEYSRMFQTLLKSPELSNYINNIKSPDVFIFFIRPSMATMKSDGVRENLIWERIISIDAQIKLLFEIFQIKYFQINTDNIQERIKLIDNILPAFKE